MAAGVADGLGIANEDSTHGPMSSEQRIRNQTDHEYRQSLLRDQEKVRLASCTLRNRLPFRCAPSEALRTAAQERQRKLSEENERLAAAVRASEQQVTPTRARALVCPLCRGSAAGMPVGLHARRYASRPAIVRA